MVEKRERSNPLKWVGLIFLGLIILNAFKEALKDPTGKGGANTPRNLQLLCEKCNIAKSNKIG